MLADYLTDPADTRRGQAERAASAALLDPDRARLWLTASHPALRGRRPSEVAAESAEGLQQVLTLARKAGRRRR